MYCKFSHYGIETKRSTAFFDTTVAIYKFQEYQGITGSMNT